VASQVLHEAANPAEGEEDDEAIEVHRRADCYALRQVDGGTAVADVCRQMGISEATFFVWKKKYANLGST